jgi:peptide/nickel transport system substrate-binding protein
MAATATYYLRRLALGIALAGAVAPAVHAESVLRIGLQDDPDSFDPALDYSFVGRIVLPSLCNKLVDTAPDLSFVPQLALSWTTAPDGRSVTFKLRPDVHFSDGTVMDAAAVAFDLDRDLHLPGSRRRSEIAAIDTIDVVDPLTVRLNLKTPFAPLIAQLSDRAGLIASPKALQNPAGFDKAPACSGPFKFDSRVAQDRVVLVRDPTYWNQAQFHIDRVEYHIIPDPTIRLADLRAGSLDFAERILASDVKALKADPRFTVLVGPSLQYNGITFNIANGTGGNPDFQKSPQLREALDLSIDRTVINQVLFDGNAVIGNQAVPPSSPYYATDRPVMPHADLAKAKALVQQSGIAHPTLQIMVTNSADQAQLGQIIQSMAKDAGIDVQLRTVEFQTQLAAQASGNFQASVIGWSGRVDPDGDTYTLLGCKSPTNDSRYCGAAEQFLLAGQSETDPAKRIELYHKALTIIADDRPIIYLYHPPLIMGMTSKLTGFVFHTDGLIRLQNVAYK